MESTLQMKRTVSEQRQSFYEEINRANLAPLWEVLHDVVTREPKTPCLPYLWQWADIWPWLLKAGDLISTQESIRRVLVLENPGLRGKSSITHSLYGGVQVIMPGEVAPSHRHSQTAMRFVLQGKGAYTTVNGQRVSMSVGDFIITPSWVFHDHGNPSDEPVAWLDGLDVALVELLDTQFMEVDSGERQVVQHVADLDLARFGNTMLPVGYKSYSRTSPLYWYPYDRTREALETMKTHDDPHECWGHKLQYTDPSTGRWAMPTMATFMQLLPAGFRGAVYRSTDSTVYAVVEGEGRCHIGGQTLAFGPKDVFVCPSWMPYRLEATTETVLFSYSDRPAQQALDLWREQIG
jgi:gentisate 1,2-dioxygenase